MSTTNNPRSHISNRDHALDVQLQDMELGTTVGRAVEYVKGNHIAPILPDAHASKRQKTTAQAEINMLNTLQTDITNVLGNVTNEQAKSSGISNAAYVAFAQSRLQNQTRFPCDTMASKAFSQTKKELQELQERIRNQSSRSGMPIGSLPTWELFDVLISVRDNVSNSPGFESFGLSLLDGGVAAQNR